MANYELNKMNPEGTLPHPTGTMYTDEPAERELDMLLSSESAMPEYGRFFNDYQFMAKKSYTFEMALTYDIECPECGGHLKQVRRCLDSHRLGLYRFPLV